MELNAVTEESWNSYVSLRLGLGPSLFFFLNALLFSRKTHLSAGGSEVPKSKSNQTSISTTHLYVAFIRNLAQVKIYSSTGRNEPG